MIRAALFTASLVACTSSSPTGVAASDLTCPDDSTLTYANFGQAFVTEHCATCHTSRQPVLTTQAAVQASTTAILAAAVTGTAMPPDGSITTAERALLGEWLTCGAP